MNGLGFRGRGFNDHLSPTNVEKSYIRECQDHGIISNLDAIQEYLLQYAHCSLIDTENRSQLLEQLLEDYPYLNLEYILQHIHVSISLLDRERMNTKRAHIDHAFDIDIANMVPIEEQQHVMYNPAKSTWSTYSHRYSRKWQNVFVKYIAQYFQKHNKNHSLCNHRSSCTQAFQVCIYSPHRILYTYTWLFMCVT